MKAFFDKTGDASGTAFITLSPENSWERGVLDAAIQAKAEVNDSKIVINVLPTVLDGTPEEAK